MLCVFSPFRQQFI